MFEKSPEELKAATPAETVADQELDDTDYEVPTFINKVLRNPELLPPEFREDFEGLFERFEFTHIGRAKTTTEYLLVNEATKLALTLEKLGRVETTILANQRRPAVESLFRKTHEGAAMKNAEAGIRASAISSATRYFSDPAFRAKADTQFEAAGYGPDALEGEAYLRALPSLTVIHRQKATIRKDLFKILKDLEARYASRHPEKKLEVEIPNAKRSKPKAA